MGLGVVSGVSWARAADSIDTIEIFGAVACFGDFVVDFAGAAGDSANFKSSVEVGSTGTCLT